MNDPASAGYEIEPYEITAFLAELDDLTDPLHRYHAATRLHALHAAVAQAATQARGEALANIHATTGMSFSEIASLIGLDPVRQRGSVQKLVERGRRGLD